MGKIGLIIPIHNELAFTKKCLTSLYEIFKLGKISDDSIDIIVVDDGSTDGSYNWISNNFTKVYLLKGDGNLWWSGAINMGAKYSINTLKTEYILLWNNDIIPDKHYFKELLNLIQISDQDTIIGSKIYYNFSFKKIWSMGGVFDPRNGEKYLIGINENDSKNYSESITVDWLPGMGTLLHKKVIETIGFWDNLNFPQYHGDSDFTYRAKLAGFKNIVYPQLKIRNDKSKSGMWHNGKLKLLLKSLVDIKSNFNISKDYIFYKKYSISIIAYLQLIGKYYKYIGGFIKWKVLNFLGIKKNEN